MTNQHPITPPPGLVQEWIDEPQYMTEDQLGKRMHMISMNEVRFREIISKASQYGADQELEACGRWIEDQLCMPPDARADVITKLNGSRRPKPPSLKELALKVLESAPGPDYPSVMTILDADQHALIRRALETLDD
jgi:hypothetical protein